MRNTMRLRQLPLLGSNQDSPDPESVVSDALRLRPRHGRHDSGTVPDHRPTEIHTVSDTPRVGVMELPAETWTAICRAFDYRCAYCGKQSRLIREHLMPRVRGGPDTLENIVPACQRCNAQKRTRTPLEWFLARSDYATIGAKQSTSPCCARCGGQMRRGRLLTARWDIVYNRCRACGHETRVSTAGVASPRSPSGR